VSFRFPEVDNAFGITEDIGRVLLDSELDDLKSAYLEASIMASKAGFDAVDIKACHGYLLNDLLAGGNRNGKYGKSFENRTRFILDVIKTVKEETDIVVTSRLSAYDGFPPPYGFGSSQNVDECTGLAEFDPSEPTRLLNEMINQGVKFVNISLGNPYYSQYITRPFDTKMPGQRDSPFHPIKGVKKHFEYVQTLKKEVPKMMFVGSGYSWLRQYSANAAAYNIQNGKADIAGWGRLAIAFPHFPRSIFESNNITASKTCITCSGCSRLLRARLRSGCIIQNKEEYRDSIRGLSAKTRKPETTRARKLS
jgi:2,4-dienoyl-CoA reductase-like NADH-dependent reductase (Old Yellow Enzyme family)